MPHVKLIEAKPRRIFLHGESVPQTQSSDKALKEMFLILRVPAKGRCWAPRGELLTFHSLLLRTEEIILQGARFRTFFSILSVCNISAPEIL